MTWLRLAIMGVRLRLHVSGARIPLPPTPHTNTDPPLRHLSSPDWVNEEEGERRGTSSARRTEQTTNLAIPLAHESSFTIRPRTPTTAQRVRVFYVIRRLHPDSEVLALPSNAPLCWHGFRGPRTRVPALSRGPFASSTNTYPH